MNKMKHIQLFEYYNIQNAYNNSQREELELMYKEAEELGYTENITGNATQGDDIAFVEAVFSGSYPRSRFSHFEMIYGLIVNDSYGKAKQQHTFSIETQSGSVIRRKGRNVYKYTTLAKPRNEEERQINLEDKYERGVKARQDRKDRIDARDDRER